MYKKKIRENTGCISSSDSFIFDEGEYCYSISECKVTNPICSEEYYYVDVFSEEDENTFLYARLYFTEKPESFEDLNKKPIIGEEIFGDWQPDNYRQTVYLHYDKLDKETALSTGKFEVYYLIYDPNKDFRSSKQRVAFAIDGKSGEYLEDKSCSTNYKLSNEILQQKIAPEEKRGLNAIEQGLENDDVTCYILSYINGKYKDKQREDIQFRFVHGGDGYWKDYFLKLEKDEFTTYESKKDKFLSDLELTGENSPNTGFAIVPIKYNGHFVTIVVDLDSKNIRLFDSSLYSLVGNSENDEEREKEFAFRKFLLDRTGCEKGAQITLYRADNLYDETDRELGCLRRVDVALNKTNLQKTGEDCGFWTIAFCLEVYESIHDFNELEVKCRDKTFIKKLRERVISIERGEEPKFKTTTKKRKLDEDDEEKEAETPKRKKLNRGKTRRESGYCLRSRGN